MTPTTFDVLVLAGRLGWPAHMLSGQMINPNATSWESRVASAFPAEIEELHTTLTALAAERAKHARAHAETDRGIEALRTARAGQRGLAMSPQLDGVDYFAQRELAITRAIQLNRDAWAGTGSSPSLFDFPQVEPPPAELRAVGQAHARARALGLTIPAFPGTTVRFVRAPANLPAGGSTRQKDGVIEMVFPVGQPLQHLRHVALHELMHVHQHATGAQLSIEEGEAAAEMFAWNAMQGWRV